MTTAATTYLVDEPAYFDEHDGMIYLTGVSTAQTRELGRTDLGYLATPANGGINSETLHYDYFAADNGCYAESKSGKPFDADRWLTWLDRVAELGNSCLFATLPDVLEWFVDDSGRDYCVGNLDATIERSAKYVDQVKALGLAAAVVAQDGLTDLDELPFTVDALFIGGSDDYKLGTDVARLIAQARERSMWVHLGRSNSRKRLDYARTIGCDSADGTFMKFCAKRDQAAQCARMVKWLDTIDAKPTLVELIGREIA